MKSHSPSQQSTSVSRAGCAVRFSWSQSILLLSWNEISQNKLMLHLWNSLTILALCIALRWKILERLIILAHHGTCFHHCNKMWELSWRVTTVKILTICYYICVGKGCYSPELFSVLLIDLNISGKCWAVFINGCIMITSVLLLGSERVMFLFGDTAHWRHWSMMDWWTKCSIF